MSKDGRRLRVAARFFTSTRSKRRNATVERLQRTVDKPPLVDQRVIVIPDAAKGVGQKATADPRVVKLGKLLDAPPWA